MISGRTLLLFWLASMYWGSDWSVNLSVHVFTSAGFSLFGLWTEEYMTGFSFLQSDWCWASGEAKTLLRDGKCSLWWGPRLELVREFLVCDVSQFWGGGWGEVLTLEHPGIAESPRRATNWIRALGGTYLCDMILNDVSIIALTIS